jgi:hypothetical protein
MVIFLVDAPATPGPSTTTKAPTASTTKPTASSTGSPSTDGQSGANGKICCQACGMRRSLGAWPVRYILLCTVFDHDDRTYNPFWHDGLGGQSPSPDICLGSEFGDCRSSGGWCGSSTAHCGSGCQSGFGVCPLNSSDISTDGLCGSNGNMCKGSTGYSDYCSVSGHCGVTVAHCDTQQVCQAAFSDCSTGSSSS